MGVIAISGLRAQDLDTIIKKRADDIWRLCFVSLRDPRAASAAALQTFLYYGERCDRDEPSLFDWAETACSDQMLRRGTRPLSVRALKRRYELGRGLEELLGKGESARTREARLALEAEEESELARAIRTIPPPDGCARELGDQAFMRFEERSVAFENRLLRIRSAADRAVPWLALAVIALCAAAAYYSSSAAPLP